MCLGLRTKMFVFAMCADASAIGYTWTARSAFAIADLVHPVSSTKPHGNCDPSV